MNLPLPLVLLLIISIVACGNEPTMFTDCADKCQSQEQNLANCNQMPPPPACLEEEPSEEPPPPPPPATLAPTSGTYDGYASIIGHVGPITAGCHPISTQYQPSRLFVRVIIENGIPNDASGHVTLQSNVATDYRFTSWTDQLGGASTAEREDRTYQLQFTPDMLRLSGRITYTRNDAAANRSQCSGYIFDAAYVKVQ